jgi:hypothetical protein
MHTLADACRGGPRDEIAQCPYTSHTNILLVFWGVTHYNYTEVNKESDFDPVSCAPG